MPPPLTTTALDTDLLAELAARRHACLAQLHALSCRQLELIENEDMSTLLGVLAAKQRLLGELQQLDRGLDPFRAQDPEQRRWRTAETRQRCAELIAQSQAMFAEIIEHEKHAELRMQARRNQAAARLQEANAGAHARSAYADESNGVRRLDVSTQ